MRLQLDRLHQIKNWIHIGQAVLLFLAWALTIGVFTASGSTNGATGWYFGLCWLTIPILIYLTMVPMWSRARRFSNVYAFAVFDSLSIVLWLSAWAAVTAYVASGKGQGTSTTATGCDNFKYGSANKCKLSEATIVLGVLIMLLFVPTAYVSFRAVMEFQRTGVLPNNQQQNFGMGGAGPLGGAKATGTTTIHDHNSRIEDEAFDSNLNARNDWEVDEYEHDEYHRDPRQGGGKYAYQRAEMHEDDEYTSAMAAHSRNTSEVMPGASYDDLSHARPIVPGGPLGHDTEYRNGGYR